MTPKEPESRVTAHVRRLFVYSQARAARQRLLPQISGLGMGGQVGSAGHSQTLPIVKVKKNFYYPLLSHTHTSPVTHTHLPPHRSNALLDYRVKLNEGIGPGH